MMDISYITCTIAGDIKLVGSGGNEYIFCPSPNLISNSSRRMTKQLHPTLKACNCGFIGPRTQFYKHMDLMVKEHSNAKEFFKSHGEAVLNFDDPRVQVVQLPPTQQEIIASLWTTANKYLLKK